MPPPYHKHLHQRPVDPRQAVFELDLSRKTALEYKADILAHIHDMDVATRPDPAMIDTQPEIDWKMWPYLIDFMIDVHLKLRLEPQTLFLAVNIVNRYCARRIVYRRHLQLVGCTALWIAAKYEEKKGKVPSLFTLSRMCCMVFEQVMFVQMEAHILNTLEWGISHCSVDTFLSICLSHGASALLTNLCLYLAELTLYRREFVGMSPHLLARTIHFLALHILSFYPNMNSQPLTSEEIECLHLLSAAITAPSAMVCKKYSASERSQVAQQVLYYVERNQPHADFKEPITPINLRSYVAGGGLPLTPPQSVPRPNIVAADSSQLHDQQENHISSAGYYANQAATSTPPHFNLQHRGFGSGSSTSLSSTVQQLPTDDSPLMMQARLDQHPLSAMIDQLSSNGRGKSPPPTPLVPPKVPFARNI